MTYAYDGALDHSSEAIAERSKAHQAKQQDKVHVALLLVGGDHALADLVLQTAGLVDDEYVGDADTHSLYRERSQSALTEQEKD